MDFGGAPSYVVEIIIALIAALVLFLALGSFELLSNYINRLDANRVDLLPNTYEMNAKSKQIVQNPNLPNALTITQSSNEAAGTEFSYSFFLNVPQQAFNANGTVGLNHIFHKGSPSQYPLLGPGVYMHNEINTLRVYMNTYNSWNNFAEVPNFPIGKWCHIVVVCRGMHMEIYVNGNIVSRLGFNVAPPYQNYGDLYAFSNRKISPPAPLPPGYDGDNTFNILGVCQGQLSRLAYFNYALSYSEINKLMNQGPSRKMDNANGMTATNYLTDNWWTADFTQ
jgi:Concanavalin A-like lectin/glucanases superfamily